MLEGNQNCGKQCNAQQRVAVEATCIERARDKNGKIISYVLEDKTGIQKRFTPQILKQQIFYGLIKVDNLTLTSDGRLIEKSAEQEESKNRAVGIDNHKVARNLIDILSSLLSNFTHTVEWSDELDSYILRFKILKDEREGLFEYKGSAVIKWNDKKQVVADELILGCKANLIRSASSVKDLLADFNVSILSVVDGKITRSKASELIELLVNYSLDTLELLTYVGSLKSKSKANDINVEETVKGINYSGAFDNKDIVAMADVVAMQFVHCLGVQNTNIYEVLFSGSNSDALVKRSIASSTIELTKKMIKTCSGGNVIYNIVGKELFEANRDIFQDYANRFDKNIERIKVLMGELADETPEISDYLQSATTKISSTRPLYMTQDDKDKLEDKPKQKKQGLFNMFKR